MRVLVVCHEYPPLGTGAANALANLLPRMAELGNDVTLLTSAFRDLPLREVDRGVSLERVACGRKSQLSPSASELLQFLWVARRHAPRMCHTFSPDVILSFFSIPGGEVARHAAKKTGIPYVVALRGSDVPGYDRKRFGGLLSLTRPWVRSIWRAADEVVPNSAWLRDLAETTSPTTQFCVIPNGVDSERFRGPTERDHARALRVLVVGQLIRRKGVDLILKAIETIAPVELHVVGDGPERDSLQRLALQLQVDSRTTWYGHLSQSELITRYRNSDVFAMATEAEGMSNSVLEAMAAGLPVVTTHAGAADVIEDGVDGMIVDREARAFGDAFRRLLSPNLRGKLGLGARRRAEKQTWDAVTQQWLALLKQSASNRTHT